VVQTSSISWYDVSTYSLSQAVSLNQHCQDDSVEATLSTATVLQVERFFRQRWTSLRHCCPFGNNVERDFSWNFVL